MNLAEIFEKVDDELIEAGDIVCIDEDGLVKKIDEQNDLFKVIGICTNKVMAEYILNSKEDIPEDKKVLVGIGGLVYAKTNDEEIVSGDLLVPEIDGTVKCKTPLEEDIDIIGMAISKPLHGKVCMIIK